MQDWVAQTNVRVSSTPIKWHPVTRRPCPWREQDGPAGYALTLGPEEIDALRFEALVSQARRSVSDENHNRAIQIFDRGGGDHRA